MSDLLDQLKTALAGQYDVEREVGSGGMATVFLARDVRHERRVAIKVLRHDLAAVLGAERFLREIRIAAQLQHPHIMPLHDSGEADGLLYYVMPFIEGESLRDRLARQGELPIADAVKVLRDVADALAYAHGQSVVHRDIKPDNVMVTATHALVTDFGVAKALSEASGNERLTTAGVAIGTPAYMAPEQAAADPSMDHRVDIYAIGALGYELLTGRPPFTGTTPQTILAAQLTETAEPVTKHRPSAPEDLSQVVMRCLEKRPADRWQTAADIVGRLNTMTTPTAGLVPFQAQPVTRPRLHWRQRRPMGAARIVVAALIGLGIGYFLPRGGRMETRTFEFDNPVDSGAIMQLVGPYLDLRAGTMSLSGGRLTVRTTPRSLARIAELVEAADVPRSVVRLRVRFVTGLDGGTADPGLADVADVLREAMPFPNYYLYADAMLTLEESSIRGGQQTLGNGSSKFDLTAAVLDLDAQSDAGTARTLLEIFAAGSRVFETTVSIPLERWVVLGNLTSVDPQQTEMIIVLVRADVMR